MERAQRTGLLPTLWLSALTAWATAGVARAADAEEIQARLRVERGATCLEARALALQVEQWLHAAPMPDDMGIAVLGDASKPRSVRVRVVREGRIVAHRAFEPGPARCEHLQAAVGLAIALAIKASVVDDLSEPLPDDPGAAPRHAWSLAGSALLTRRLLPELAPGGELVLGRDLGEHLRLRGGLLAVAATGMSLAAQTGGFDAALVAARVDGCVRTRLVGALHGGVCFGLLCGVLGAAGRDLGDAERSVVGWAALSNALELSWSLSPRWSLALGGSATFLLHDVQIGLEDPQGMRLGARSLDAAAFALGLGPVYSF